MTARSASSLLLTVAFLASCGGDDEPAAPAAKTAAEPASASARAEPPYGVYVRRVTRADFARTARTRSEYGPDQELPPTGRYQLLLAKGSGQDVLKVTDPEGFTIDMDVTIEARLLSATTYVDPSRGSFCGPEVPAPATYDFRREGATLRLTPTGDPCADRDSILSGRWTSS